MVYGLDSISNAGVSSSYPRKIPSGLSPQERIDYIRAFGGPGLKPQAEKKDNTSKIGSGIIGTLVGAAVTAGIFLLTRGKSSSALRNLSVIKNDKGNLAHLTQYANGIKTVCGKNADKISFIRASKLNDFAKEKGFIMEGIEDLSKNDILAVITKSDEPLFTSIFKFNEWTDDLAAAFDNKDIFKVVL